MEEEKSKAFCPRASLAVLTATDWLPPTLPGDQSSALSYRELLKLAEEEKDEALSDSIRVIAWASSLSLNVHNPAVPFNILFQFPDGRSAALEDFTADHLEILDWAAPRFSHPYLRAKLSDVVWARLQRSSSAETALFAYAELIRTKLENPKNAIPTEKYLIRGAQLFLSLGKQEKHRLAVLEPVRQYLAGFNEEPEGYERCQIFCAAVKNGLIPEGESRDWLTKAEQFADQCQAKKDFEKEREYIEAGVKLARKLKDNEKTKTLLLRSAFTYEARLSNLGGTDAIFKMGLVGDAIQAYKRISAEVGSQKEKIDSLRLILNQVSAETNQNLGTVSKPFDVSSEVKRFLEVIGPLDTASALVEVAKLAYPNKLSELKDQAKGSFSGLMMDFIASGVVLGDKGRAVSRSQSAEEISGDEVGVAHLVKLFEFHVSVVGVVIQAALDVLQRRCDFDQGLLLRLLLKTNFISEPNRRLILRGFWDGFQCDWQSSLHILIPQFENCLRDLLESLGLIVDHLSDEMTHDERDLGFLLTNPKAKALLDPDWTFQAHCLFVNKSTFNFRHRLSHGLVSDWDFALRNPACAFIWAHLLLTFLVPGICLKRS